ncbi:helix-turn-helix and ligand-binding sensor domain-containing protein [Nonlabens xiamenensis]|uniref:helix-turn-helix and ligand-binding sensor domain-containing protein n=1 Tax=Nonlabens xiamenensis TaxID=2341043 RepID=UPI0013DE1087|nr:LuxR C-terminal-related transcriptional regulator [Nonlabens xiamenensis]
MLPEIVNYSFGGVQNWGVDTDEEEVIYAANNAGLTVYNGQFWRLHELPQNTIIRSVRCLGERIYTGSYEEFGYWQKDNTGQLIYHSLKESFGANPPLPSEEFWQIIPFGDQVVFRSFGAVYLYDGSTINRILEGYAVSRVQEYQGRLVVATLNNGLLQISEEGIRAFETGGQTLDIESFSQLAVYQDQLFAYSPSAGGFFIDPQNIRPVSPELNQLLKQQSLNSVQFIDDQRLVFGTIKNGIYLMDNLNQDMQMLNKQAGINNNTVLDLHVSGDRLWAALDNGLSRINISGALAYFNDPTGVLGTVYDLAVIDQVYYLASNTGIYRYYNDQLQLIPGSEGQCWSLYPWEDGLLCGHNNGAFWLKGEQLSLIPGSFSGVYDYTPIPGDKNLLLATYSGLGHLNVTEGLQITRISGLDRPIEQVSFDHEGHWYASGFYQGLYKSDFAAQGESPTNWEPWGEDDIFQQNKVKLNIIDNTIYLAENNRWWMQSMKGFQEVPVLTDQKLLGQTSDELWFWDQTSTLITRRDVKFKSLDTWTNSSLVERFVPGFQKVLIQNDSTLLLNLIDGFARWDVTRNRKDNDISPAIGAIYLNNTAIPLENMTDLTISHAQARTVVVEAYVPQAQGSELEYDLKGQQEQKGKIPNGKLMLQNLPAGDYELSIYETAHPHSPAQLNFEVLPPWYWSPLMKLLYLILFIASLFAVGRFQKRREQKASIDKQNRLKIAAQKEIAEIERKNLLKEIKNKKKELTNTTASMVQKNETIISLRNELKRLEKSSPNVTRTKNILHRSGQQLDSKKDWSLFESRFSELNEDFFNKLSHAYPKLTTKDKKLCAYIKIGLTSKEIAPLLGITKRSVELQRYRLRKKLNLDTKISFIEFLDRF